MKHGGDGAEYLNPAPKEKRHLQQRFKKILTPSSRSLNKVAFPHTAFVAYGAHGEGKASVGFRFPVRWLCELLRMREPDRPPGVAAAPRRETTAARGSFP